MTETKIIIIICILSYLANAVESLKFEVLEPGVCVSNHQLYYSNYREVNMKYITPKNGYIIFLSITCFGCVKDTSHVDVSFTHTKLVCIDSY